MDVDGSPAIDVETIASSYAPPAAIARLLFIAEKTTSDATRLESLKLAINLLKTKTSDTATYARVVERVDGRLGDDYALDKGWIEETDKASANRQAVLERELSAYKTNSIKESVRMGHNDLGDFHHSRGALSAAFKCYVRARDYCTTPRHVVGMCLNVVRVSIESENFAHVGNYVQKALATAPDVGKEEPTVFAKLQVASALAYLDQKKYKDAATKFTELGMELEEEYNEVVTAGDVATYGALCALGASRTLVPIRPRRRGERRSLRTFSPGVSPRPSLAFNPRPRRLSTPFLTPLNSTPISSLVWTLDP